MYRIRAVVLAMVVLAASVIAARAAGVVRAPVSMTVASGSGECTIAWNKQGVTFTPVSAGKGPSAYAMSDAVGTGEADLANASDPVALAGSLRGNLTGKGGFSLSDASGHRLDASDPQGTLPSLDTTYLVKSAANPAGTRIPLYDSPFSLVPEVSSVLPPGLKVTINETQGVLTPEFADVLNATFGDGSASAGAPFGGCSGAFST